MEWEGSWFKDNAKWIMLLVIGIIIGGTIGILVSFDWNEDYSLGSSIVFDKGLFGINDVYNTCSYVSETQGVLFDGYCYNQLPSESRAIESCITGCKLQADWNEDYSKCSKYCEDNLVD